MKNIGLNKDQLQKVILSTLGFIGLIYVYFTFFLGPLNRSREGMLDSISGLQTTIDDSKKEIAKVAVLERQAKEATQHLADLKALSPEGAPIAWFPPRIKAFFAHDQIEKTVARLLTSASAKDRALADWTKYSWQINLPETDYGTFGKAIADLENAELLLCVNRVSIHTVASDPALQQVELVATNNIQTK